MIERTVEHRYNQINRPSLNVRVSDINLKI